MDQENKPASPQRPRGAAAPDEPQIAKEHGVAVSAPSQSYAGSSRSSLFGLFRRQPRKVPSQTSLRSARAPAPSGAPAHAPPPSSRYGNSVRESTQESLFGAFDNMSFDLSRTSLESPEEVHATGRKVDEMLVAAAKYRRAMEALAEAAAEFGNTLYDCASTKGAAGAVAGRSSQPSPPTATSASAAASTAAPAAPTAPASNGAAGGTNVEVDLDHEISQAQTSTDTSRHVDADLQASGGLHLLIANHAKLLALSLERQLETPMRRDRQRFRQRLTEREGVFKANLRRQMGELRKSEQQRAREAPRRRGRSANRDLFAYRNTLMDLTSKIDDINRLKFEFLGDLHSLTTDLAEDLHRCMSSAVTAEIEVFESIARKGWTGGGLDGLLSGCPDPFANQRGEQTEQALTDDEQRSAAGSAEGNLFSVLPAAPLLPRRQNSQDSLLVEDDGPALTPLRISK